MHYEINVSLNGRHFFATHERSIQNEMKLDDVYVQLRKAFTPEDGYQISVTRWEQHGHVVKMD